MEADVLGYSFSDEFGRVPSDGECEIVKRTGALDGQSERSRFGQDTLLHQDSDPFRTLVTLAIPLEGP
jgi:hypothetical protein